MMGLTPSSVASSYASVDALNGVHARFTSGLVSW